MKQTIGHAIIEYSPTGEVLEAEFTPSLQVDYTTVKDQMRTVGQAKDLQDMKYNAELLMAAWFSRVTEVELADREKYEVVVEEVKCVQHTNGLPKECNIRYVLQTREG